ncbi:DEAD/DEAH box helicase [Pseudohalioglobus sediminis]|uniref:ATP-dependent RNA helicase DeaD n=1 Tax=Pseudohalioglobus sediminis TaxID=2606449 RepID=A0A5B0WRH7_9GAMM|nr:DEAD/DEAH box helicase [Pseudohalioglobus sediminis]KAA1189662.1 DEAD/DEAH box helicase [Pseudohalioglobus sediminis]
MSTQSPVTSFAELALPAPLQQALADVGYENPSAIQAATIPALLDGRDVLGQAQTGTGKTAAFALPALASLQSGSRLPQVLVLTPTRELAIQVAEAFQKYARHLKSFHVLPIYGGADYRGQLRQLQRGVQVVVGTPGRVMDHMRRGSLDLSALRTLVLDEADEMLRMGFIDDVQWILEQTPEQRQVALFSATMPDAIRRIAQKHLEKPVEVSIEVQTVINESIRQRVWMMAGVHKLDALTRILEVEEFDAAIVFVRTRLATAELADKLAARGYATAALNGDIPQKQRESTIEKLKAGKFDILVATDVAARGLDVERISHVINYDIPYDVEAYVHRIGRTGRAGRQGDAILFAANRERRLLRAIEKATGQTIEKMALPSVAELADKRMARFKQRITETLATAELDAFRKLVEDYQAEYGVPVMDIAAALGALAQGDKPLTARAEQEKKEKKASKPDKNKPAAGPGAEPSRERGKTDARPDKGMERFRIEVGHEHGVKPANIVGAIANEAELDAQYIGRIEIYDDHSTVDLPEGMPPEILRHLKSVWVSGQRLQASRLKDAGGKPRKRKQGAGKKNRQGGGKKQPR